MFPSKCVVLLLGTTLNLHQAPSGPETTVAFSVLLLDQLIERLTAPDNSRPWRGRSYVNKSSPGGDNSGITESSTQQARLHALVLTRNRDIAANVKVSAVMK